MGLSDHYKMLSSGTFVFGTGCVLPFALALPHSVVSNTGDFQSNTLQTDGFADSSFLTAPSSTSLPSHTLAISPWTSGGNQVTDDPHAIAEALVLFVLFALIVLSLYWFGPYLRRRLLTKAGKQPIVGLGFGFDGLTKAQLRAVRLKEKDQGMNGEWFIKLPAKPPTIALKEVPLPPIQLEMRAEILEKSGRS